MGEGRSRSSVPYLTVNTGRGVMVFSSLFCVYSRNYFLFLYQMIWYCQQTWSPHHPSPLDNYSEYIEHLTFIALEPESSRRQTLVEQPLFANTPALKSVRPL